MSFRAHANGDYVDAANSTTSLIANATSIGAAETFDMFTNTDGTIDLRAHSDNEWVTAESNGSSPLIATATARPLGDVLADPQRRRQRELPRLQQQHIVTADNAGASPLIANRTAIGAWEEFDLVTTPRQ